MQHQTTGNVEIQNIQVKPAIVRIGDTFTVSATLVNNLQNPISVTYHNYCGTSFFVVFDNHVTTDTIPTLCAIALRIATINPGEKLITVGPDSVYDFRATTSGIANATIIFSYTGKNQTDPNGSYVSKTISKSFLFTILDQSAKQTTEDSEFYKPTLSDDQVAQIITSDLSKHLPTFTKVIIEGRDPIPNNPDYPKHPLRLWYVAPNGTQFFINSTYSLVGECAPNDTYCGIHDPSGFKITSGRLVYYVDLLWYAKDNLNGPAQYAVDAHNGDVLYSTLLENMTPQDIKNKYVP